MDIGRKSTLFLAYAYELDPDGETQLKQSADWKAREIKGVALLPHLDEYVKRGELLRAYDVNGDLRAAFGSKEAWKLVDTGDAAIEITITEPPRIYVLDTRYAFIVLSIAPVVPKGEELTLATIQDISYALIRAGVTRVAATSPQMTKWLESHRPAAAGEPVILRRWLASFVPGLPPDAPRGSARTTAPAVFSVIMAKEPLDSDAKHRLRLVHRSTQVVEGAGESSSDAGEWKISNRELCLFSAFGVTWIVTTDGREAAQFLNDAPHMIRDRYIFKWLLVEHQRLCLLALNTECADMSRGLDGSNFAEMRMRLLEFIAKYNFHHVSNEERHDRFYRRARAAVHIDDLLSEVREEVVEIDTQLAARRSELLNHVLAFLTLVLTPVGVMIGIFQADTVPGPLRWHSIYSPSSWLALITHPPFLTVLAVAATGAAVYSRIFGLRVIANQFRRQLLKSRE